MFLRVFSLIFFYSSLILSFYSGQEETSYLSLLKSESTHLYIKKTGKLGAAGSLVYIKAKIERNISASSSYIIYPNLQPPAGLYIIRGWWGGGGGDGAAFKMREGESERGGNQIYRKTKAGIRMKL